MAEASVSEDQVPSLYGFYTSSCSYRVRIAVNVKGIKVKHRAYYLETEDGFEEEELLKLNPRGQLPVLVIDGVPLAESVAIIEYLEETRPEPPLLPTDPKQRALIRKVVQHINSGIQPLQNMAVLEKLEECAGEGHRKPWAQHYIRGGLAAVEEEVKTSAGQYCFGDQVTMADVYLMPQVFNAGRYEVDMAQFPTLARIAQNLALLPAFQDAHPAKQIDAPKEGPLY